MCGGGGGGNNQAAIDAAAEKAAIAEREKIEIEKETERFAAEQKLLSEKREQANRESRSRLKSRLLLQNFVPEEDDEEEGALVQNV